MFQLKNYTHAYKACPDTYETHGNIYQSNPNTSQMYLAHIQMDTYGQEHIQSTTFMLCSLFSMLFIFFHVVNQYICPIQSCQKYIKTDFLISGFISGARFPWRPPHRSWPVLPWTGKWSWEKKAWLTIACCTVGEATGNIWRTRTLRNVFVAPVVFKWIFWARWTITFTLPFLPWRWRPFLACF